MPKKTIHKIRDMIMNPRIRFSYLTELGLTSLMPDEAFISKEYFYSMGKKIDLDNPQTFNEKLQWLKLHDRKPIYTTLSDKFRVKQYVANVVGADYVIPTLGIWNRFEEINFDTLPEKFVLKCTHDSGSVVICNDKSCFDNNAAMHKICHSLRRKYFYIHREWPYKKIKPQLIAEPYLVDESGDELKDYKFFCFHGKAKFFKVDFARFVCHHANYYDMDCNLLPFGEADFPPDPSRIIHFPDNLLKMIEIAEKLAYGIPFVRIDLYNIKGKIFFGEMTFYPAAGFGRIIPDEYDLKIGRLLDISSISS